MGILSRLLIRTSAKLGQLSQALNQSPAQHIAQLPLASKKLLAMYYYENLPISEIAACFNLPACRIYETLTQTVGLLGNDVLKFISRNVT